MPVVDVINQKKEKVSEIVLKDEIFNVAVKPSVLHEVVVMQLNNRRAGTASTKGRSEISGGGKKPWKQKGTGRARAGTNRSPLWRGGGTVFGPKPRDYRYRVPRQVRKLALKMALSSRYQTQHLLVLDQFSLDRPKTKDLSSILGTLALKKVLIVAPGGKDQNLHLCSRNIPGITVLPPGGLNVYDILKHEDLILLAEAIPPIEEALTV